VTDSAHVESPAVARRRLRRELRDLRESRELTQAEVARKLQWSLSKVNRIETGEVTVSATDLEAMLSLYGVGDEPGRARLVTYCKLARRRGWWDKPEIRPHLSPALTNLLQFQSDAVRIGAFGATIVPGFIQTREMAEVILAGFSDDLTAEQRDARLEYRLRLRDQAVERADGPKCTVVLDESVLLRELGGLRTLKNQLKDLLDLVRRKRLDVRILPLTTPNMFAFEAPFMLAELDDGDLVVYREGITDEFIDDRSTVERYRRVFDRQVAASLNSAASRRLIEARTAYLVSALDRPFQ
jgi:transcriptional regulator with XRE-family HTH domain